jgi:hypothetical protein
MKSAWPTVHINPFELESDNYFRFLAYMFDHHFCTSSTIIDDALSWPSIDQLFFRPKGLNLVRRKTWLGSLSGSFEGWVGVARNTCVASPVFNLLKRRSPIRVLTSVKVAERHSSGLTSYRERSAAHQLFFRLNKQISTSFYLFVVLLNGPSTHIGH